MILPVVSNVSVLIPNLIVATYSLYSDVSNSHSLVVLPTHTTRTPVAIGSKVPVWPIFLVISILVNLLTTSHDVKSIGLLIRRIPFILSFLSIVKYWVIYSVFFW